MRVSIGIPGAGVTVGCQELGTLGSPGLTGTKLGSLARTTYASNH